MTCCVVEVTDVFLVEVQAATAILSIDSTAAMRSPIHSITGRAMELPTALYLGPSTSRTRHLPDFLLCLISKPSAIHDSGVSEESIFRQPFQFGILVYSSSKPCSLSHSTGVRRRTCMPSIKVGVKLLPLSAAPSVGEVDSE